MSPTRSHRATLAVWTFTSCDGCQVALLDAEEQLLALSRAVHVARFDVMTRTRARGPYDISLVEGSITTAAQIERLREVRAASSYLVAIGACAGSGGIQALRNAAAPGAFAASVYAHPEYLDSLETSSAVAEHVRVDLEVRGCPVATDQLVEVVLARLAGRRPVLTAGSVCADCKARAVSCVLVARGEACLGPVTLGGCGALCPASGRGCYGCYGPREDANTGALADRLSQCGASSNTLSRLFATVHAGAPAFHAESDRWAHPRTDTHEEGS